MYRPRLLQFFIVFLILGNTRVYNQVMRCAHCTMFRNGTCLHPLGFIPPMTECGVMDEDQMCYTILLQILDVRADSSRHIDFGVNFGGISIYKFFS
ncbi:hypothetical protein ILUMI_11107 [Ignelater luminosus]|uniref:Uncharacterized protein n=1 Tax=Ignelater luminosus TaxID=2038154 RepID=A0A8K0D137_IGNLU|nr:hypothetical protein ILUMI_11107 [Ignelater luminosus]